MRFILIQLFWFVFLSAQAQNENIAKPLKEYSKRDLWRILHETEYGHWRAEFTIGDAYNEDTIQLSKPDDGSHNGRRFCIWQEWVVKKSKVRVNVDCTIYEEYKRFPGGCKPCGYKQFNSANPYRLKLVKERDSFFVILKGKDKTIETYYIASLEKWIGEFPQSVLTLININKQVAAKSPESTADSFLETGFYYVVYDKTGLKRQLNRDTAFYYLNPIPIVTAKNFRKMKVDISIYGDTFLAINLDRNGIPAWSEATKKATGKELALIVDNRLLTVAVVHSQITSGAATLGRDVYSRKDLEEIMKQIEE